MTEHASRVERASSLNNTVPRISFTRSPNFNARCNRDKITHYHAHYRVRNTDLERIALIIRSLPYNIICPRKITSISMTPNALLEDRTVANERDKVMRGPT